MKGKIESIEKAEATHEYASGVSKFKIVLLVVMVKNFPVTDGKPNVEVRMSREMNYDTLYSILTSAFTLTRKKGSMTRLLGFPGLEDYVIDRKLVVMLQKKLESATVSAKSSKQNENAIIGNRTFKAHGTSAKWMSLKKNN